MVLNPLLSGYVWILHKKSLKLYCPRSQLVQLHHVKSGTQIIERILYIIFCFWEQFYITLRPPWGQEIEIVRTLNVESGRIKCRGQCKVSLLGSPLLSRIFINFKAKQKNKVQTKCGIFIKNLVAKDNGIWTVTVNFKPRGGRTPNPLVQTVDLSPK